MDSPNGGAAEQQQPRRLRAGGQRERRAPGGDVGEVGALGLAVAVDTTAGVDQDAVLEGRVDVEVERGAGVEQQLGARAAACGSPPAR